jgi:hypothetical protein
VPLELTPMIDHGIIQIPVLLKENEFLIFGVQIIVLIYRYVDRREQAKRRYLERKLAAEHGYEIKERGRRFFKSKINNADMVATDHLQTLTDQPNKPPKCKKARHENPN